MVAAARMRGARRSRRVPDSATSRAGSAPRPAASVARFSLAFVGMVALLSGAVLVDGLVFGGAAAWALSAKTAVVVTDILRLFGADAVVSGNQIHHRTFICRVIPECTGIDFIGLFVAAVAALPSTWKSKLLGFGLGIPILIALNLLRIVLLVLAGARWPEAVEAGHLYVAPLIILTATLGMWLFWADRATHAARS